MTEFLNVGVLMLTAFGTFRIMHIINKILMNKVAVTEEGLWVSFGDMIRLEKKQRWRKKKKWTMNGFTLESQKENIKYWLRLSLIGGMLVLANTIPFIPDGAKLPVAIGLILVFGSILQVNLLRKHRQVKERIGEMSVTAPVGYRKYGIYALNPFDIKEAFKKIERLKSQEELWIRKLKQLDSRIIEGNDSLKVKAEWKKTEAGLERVRRDIEALQMCIKNELLTDNKPDYLKDLSLKTAPHPPVLADKYTPTITKKVEAPYHIEMMKAIATDNEMPDKLKEQAKELILRHNEKEIAQQREAKINQAKLEIETVSKYYDK